MVVKQKDMWFRFSYNCTINYYISVLMLCCLFSREFDILVDLGCGRGYVSKHLLKDTVKTIYQCEMSEKMLVNILFVSVPIHNILFTTRTCLLPSIQCEQLATFFKLLKYIFILSVSKKKIKLLWSLDHCRCCCHCAKTFM